MPLNGSVWVYSGVPLVLIATVILSWVSLTSPSRGNLSDYSLLSITPPPDQDGPSVWLGLFCSCARSTNSSEIKCDYTAHLKLNSKYDLSVLPSEAPLFLLRSPPDALRVVAWVTTALSIFFWSIALFVPFVMWRETREIYHLDLRCCFIWTAFLLSFIGVTNSLAINLYFETARQNFNTIITRPGAPELRLIASRGNCFKLAISGYAAAAFPFFAMLCELCATHEGTKNGPFIHWIGRSGAAASRWTSTQFTNARQRIPGHHITTTTQPVPRTTHYTPPPQVEFQIEVAEMVEVVATVNQTPNDHPVATTSGVPGPSMGSAPRLTHPQTPGFESYW